MKRRVLSLILSLTMLTTMQPATVLAESTEVASSSAIEISDSEDVCDSEDIADIDEIIALGEDAPTSGVIEYSGIKWSLKKTEDLTGFILTINPSKPDSSLYLKSNKDPQPWENYKKYIQSVVIENDPLYGEEGASITKIGASMFELHTKLQSVTLPDTITNIGSYAFYKCYKLEEINLPHDLKNIDNYAFEYCHSLKNITLPSTLETIAYCAFSNTGLKQVHIPASVTTIGNGAFAVSEHADYRSLEKITVDPDNQHYMAVDNVLFTKDMKKLVQYPEMKTGDYSIPDGVEEIGVYAFSLCKNLNSITFPASVKKIDNNAFYKGSISGNITLNEGLISIGIHSFDGAEISSIHLPSTFLPPWKKLKVVHFMEHKLNQ